VIAADKDASDALAAVISEPYHERLVFPEFCRRFRFAAGGRQPWQMTIG
jgi:hypothetical protein